MTVQHLQFLCYLFGGLLILIAAYTIITDPTPWQDKRFTKE